MNLPFIAAIAFFFGLAAASLAVRIANADTSSRDSDQTSAATRPAPEAGLTQAS